MTFISLSAPDGARSRSCKSGFTVGLGWERRITRWGEGCKIPQLSDRRSAGYAHHVRVRVPLTVGIAGARMAARLSRLVGAGGGTTVPGKVLSSLDPEVLDRLAQRLHQHGAV